jgi:hypothetical protein
MNNLDHISESLEKMLGVKLLKIFDADPGSAISGMEKIRIRDKHPGSVTCLVQYRNPEEPQILKINCLCGLLKKNNNEFFLIFSGRCQ